MAMDIETMLMFSFTIRMNGQMLMETWSEITPTNATKTPMAGMILMEMGSACLPICFLTILTNGRMLMVME